MADHLFLMLVADKLRSIARTSDRDAAEGEAARLEIDLTDNEVTLLAGYLAFLAEGQPDRLPAESHAALLERISVRPDVLIASGRKERSADVSPHSGATLREGRPEVIARLFVDLDDAVTRYLCVSVALVYDMAPGTVDRDSESQSTALVNSVVQHAVRAESGAAGLTNELAEILLDLWTQRELRPRVEVSLRELVAAARRREIPPYYFEGAIRSQALLFGGEEGARLEALLGER